LYVIPLSERPLFPPQNLALVIHESRWVETVRRIGETPHRLVGLALADPDPDRPGHERFRPVGTVARMREPRRVGAQIHFVAQGLRRFRVLGWPSGAPPYVARVDYPGEVGPADPDEVRAYGITIVNTLRELMPLNPLYSAELKHFLERFNIHDPSSLADFAASLTTASRDDLQGVLEAVHLQERMEQVLVLIRKELEVARIQARLRQQVEQTVSDRQRRYFLREQLKAIQKELGLSKDDRTADLERFRGRIEGRDLPAPVRERIDQEIEKLSVLESGSPEYGVTRNYLDVLTALPWGQVSPDQVDLAQARAVLDRDHDGLEDVKERILELLAVGALKGSVSGSILLLAGPPGVGKTSIGRSVAEALGRRFYRFSLGGMRDEAEIKGHRRTYIGAMPGKFVQAIRECGTLNPVVMLDEIDKVGASYRGDPASALLEVLDPEQNRDFLDHYLDVRIDLSRVLFICTANQLDTIPRPLLDRMEVIRLAGYITDEKLAIARNHLWPGQLERAGLRPGQVRITDAALRTVIDGYAREAGVRNLDKQLGRLARRAVVQVVGGERGPIRIGTRRVAEVLGKPVFRREASLRGVGVVTGLAWTALGGATLSIEASRIHTRNRGFKLTGKLGDVMRESAEIAYSYVTSHLRELGGDARFFDEAFVHLHVPEGATPKDGPSAGITMATALLSLAREERVGRPLAMTGELTLTGRVLPVGGVREKVIAARRSRIPELVLPEANRPDFEGLPEPVRRGLRVQFAARYRDVYRVVFGGG
jgi:ATP-dependent Lon protease